jgi:transcriptional regulator with XRE-family HTH domain
MSDSDLREKIIELRNKAGLSITDLAKKAEIQRSALNNIELKKRGIGIATLRKIANALGYDLIIKFVKKK